MSTKRTKADSWLRNDPYEAKRQHGVHKHGWSDDCILLAMTSDVNYPFVWTCSVSDTECASCRARRASPRGVFE